MRVIPVLDIQHSIVVRGVAGRRDEYRPIASSLTPSSAPLDVARALVRRFGLREHYLADLDAIRRGRPNWDAYRAIRALGVSLIVDAGLRGVDDARRMAGLQSEHAAPAVSVVAALETLPDVEALSAVLELIGPDRLLFSLDMREGRLLCGAGWREPTPLDIARAVVCAGVRRMIVLDLARVGVGEGVGTESLCRQLNNEHPSLEIIAGGGVRGMEDLRRLANAGCSGALVASALHDGRLSASELAALDRGRDRVSVREL